VLFVGRTTYRLPLEPSLERKWQALADRMQLRVLASGTGVDPRFTLTPPRPLAGPRFYAGLPARVARELRSFRPDLVIAESPYEGAAVELARRLTRLRVALVVEVHGDWHASTRLYGSPARRLLAPLSDRVAAWSLHRADGHRALSPYTAALVRAEGREPAGVFPTYSDLQAFTVPTTAVPESERVVFVGVLERYKNIDGLAAAWALVASRRPEAQLQLVGTGRETEVARRLATGGVEWTPRLDPAELARALDAARALVLPSRSEGLGRVIIEAFMRGRGVVAARVGGINDLVSDGVNGLLVEPADTSALAAALERVLTDHPLAVSLGEQAARSAGAWVASAEEYADDVAALVSAVLAQAG
jgi:glycosyltransferase involved in cell wall biosynthesis